MYKMVLLLVLVMVANFASGAVRTWSSSGSSSWNTAANWSGTTLPGATDTAMFDGTSVVNCTTDANFKVGCIIQRAAFTGIFKMAAATKCTTAAFIDSFGSGGTTVLSGRLVHQPAKHIKFAKAFDGTTFVLYVIETANLTYATGQVFDTLKYAYSGKTDTIGTGTIYVNSLLPQSGTWANSATLFVRPTASCTIWGTRSTCRNLGSVYVTPTASAKKLVMKNFICTNTGNLGYWPDTSASMKNDTFHFIDSQVVATTANMYLTNAGTVNSKADTSTVYSFLSAPVATRVIAQRLYFGTENANSSAKYRWGPVTYNVDTVAPVSTGTDSNYWATSTWNVGTVTLVAASASDYDSTASTFTFIKKGLVTSNGKSYYNWTMADVTQTDSTKLGDNLTVSGNWTLTKGKFAGRGFNVTVTGNAQIDTFINDAGSTITFGGNYTATTNAKFIHDANTRYIFNLSGAAVTTASKPLPTTTFNANFTVYDSDTIDSLVYGTDGITGTYQSGKTYVITRFGAANWNGTAGSLNKFRATVAATFFSFRMPAAATLSYVNPKNCHLIAPNYLSATDGTSIGGGDITGWIWKGMTP